MLYFAYGPNMDEQRVKAPDRCPDARFIFKAVLPGYRLVFTQRAGSESGAADATADPASLLWGVVYDISEADRKRLDSRETASHRAYRPKEVLIHPHGDMEQRVIVLTYLVNDPAAVNQPPTREHLDFLLRGARHWGLPSGYIAQLERIEAGR